MLVTGALRALRQPGHAFPYWTFRACSNAPSELSHIFLTALARSAQWTGVYADGLDALVHNFAVTVMTGMLATMRDLVVRRSSTRLLHPNSKSCITVFQPTPAHAPHSSNSPAHARMF